MAKTKKKVEETALKEGGKTTREYEPASKVKAKKKKEEVVKKKYNPKMTPLIKSMLDGMVTMLSNNIDYCVSVVDNLTRDIGEPINLSHVNIGTRMVVQFVDVETKEKVKLKDLGAKWFDYFVSRINDDFDGIEKYCNNSGIFTEYQYDYDDGDIVDKPITFDAIMTHEPEDDVSDALKFLCVLYGYVCAGTNQTIRDDGCLDHANFGGILYTPAPITIAEYDEPIMFNLDNINTNNAAWDLFIRTLANLSINLSWDDDHILYRMAMQHSALAMMLMNYSTGNRPILIDGRFNLDALMNAADDFQDYIRSSVQSAYALMLLTNYHNRKDTLRCISRVPFALFTPNVFSMWLTGTEDQYDNIRFMNPKVFIAASSICQYLLLVKLSIKDRNSVNSEKLIMQILDAIRFNDAVGTYLWDVMEPLFLLDHNRIRPRIDRTMSFETTSNGVLKRYSKLNSLGRRDLHMYKFIRSTDNTNRKKYGPVSALYLYLYSFINPCNMIDLIELLNLAPQTPMSKPVRINQPTVLLYELLMTMTLNDVTISEQGLAELASFIYLCKHIKSNTLRQLGEIINKHIQYHPAEDVHDYVRMRFEHGLELSGFIICGDPVLYACMMVWLSRTSLINAMIVLDALHRYEGKPIDLYNLIRNHEVTDLIERDGTVTIP